MDVEKEVFVRICYKPGIYPPMINLVTILLNIYLMEDPRLG